MTTTINKIFDFNGVISTNKTVMQNLQIMADAAGVFIVYDYYSGQWSIVVNGPSDPVATITDSNIIGSVNVTSTSIDQMYDTVEISFPNKDVMDNQDQLTYQIDVSERWPYEQMNILNMSTDLINDSAAAGIMAMRQLRMSRLDKVIKFQTDYSMLGLLPGDVVNVTVDALEYVNKKFRILTVEENDADNGAVFVNFTMLEYDPKVYDYSNIDYYKRFNGTSITQIASNLQIQQLDALAAAGLPISQLFSFGTDTIWADHNPLVAIPSFSTGYEYTIPYTGVYKVSYIWVWVMRRPPPPDFPIIDLGITKVYGISLRNGNSGGLIEMRYANIVTKTLSIGGPRSVDFGETTQSILTFIEKGTLLQFETRLRSDHVTGTAYLNFDPDTAEPYYMELPEDCNSGAIIYGELSLVKKTSTNPLRMTAGSS